MRSDLYWEERALQREEYARRASTRAIKTKTVKLYAKAQKDLDARINRILSRYAANGELTLEEARRMLNTKEAELEALRKELNNIKDPVIKRKALARLNAPAYAARINRLEALKANIETETALLADREKRELNRLLEDVSGDTYYRSIYDTQIGTGLGFEFSALSKGAVNTIVNDRWKGANFSDRIWQNTSALANSAYGIVARGIMTGAGPQVMARQLAEAMQSGMYNSMRLIRTETNRVHNAAEKVAYEEEGITEYRFLATLDGRTCDVCGALDGKTFPVSEAKEGINYPPLHPNDRCTTTAVIEGQNRAELKRRALDPETGKTVLIPAETTYEEWLADNINPLTGKLKYYPPKTLTQVSSYNRDQFERYSAVLKENVPDSLDEFLKIKYNDPEKWKTLKRQYRLVNQYKIDSGNLSTDEILRFDKKVIYEKRLQFTSKYKRSGNVAGAYIDDDFDNMYYAHSQIDEGTKGYKGTNKLVELKTNRRFEYIDVLKTDGTVRRGTFRDTEAKLFEYSADLYEEKPFKKICMLSERGMCDSCKGVMRQFQELHPDVEINVVSNKTVEGDVWKRRMKSKK
jgi:SPP1 gp7 family putative phage head morphogenesis protein